MANLSLTYRCNKQCAYCFAGSTTDTPAFMSLDLFKSALKYLKRSGINQARLLGGEPTLHPLFINFVNIALDHGLDIMLFTNGLINKKTRDDLKKIPSSSINILLNTIHPNEKNLAGKELQEKTMKELGEKIIVGINIYSESQDLFYLLEYVKKHKLKKEVRLGLAHPMLGKQNAYLHPKQYKKIGDKIIALKVLAAGQGISLTLDCGFVPCMFDNKYHQLLNTELKNSGNCCQPIIDLMPNGYFIACYPLNNFHQIELNEQLAAQALKKQFNKKTAPYNKTGIYPACQNCSLFQGACNGGCLSHKIQRFKF